MTTNPEVSEIGNTAAVHRTPGRSERLPQSARFLAWGSADRGLRILTLPPAPLSASLPTVAELQELGTELGEERGSEADK